MADGPSESRSPHQAGIGSCQNGSSRSYWVAMDCGTGTNFARSRPFDALPSVACSGQALRHSGRTWARASTLRQARRSHAQGRGFPAEWGASASSGQAEWAVGGVAASRLGAGGSVAARRLVAASAEFPEKLDVPCDEGLLLGSTPSLDLALTPHGARLGRCNLGVHELAEARVATCPSTLCICARRPSIRWGACHEQVPSLSRDASNGGGGGNRTPVREGVKRWGDRGWGMWRSRWHHILHHGGRKTCPAPRFQGAPGLALQW